MAAMFPPPPGRRPARPLTGLLLSALLAAAPAAASASPMPPSGSPDGAPAGLDDLDWEALRERGLRLDRDRLFNRGDGGLAAAVVRLEGCDGVLLGEHGLIATTYDCARRTIRYGEVPAPVPPGAGFTAATWADEIPLPGRQGMLVAGGGGPATAQPDRVDLRLAWLPPPELGAFGGTEEDGAWPHHRGDLALLRAWIGDGAGAARPYRPPRFLVVDTRGVRPGDLVLALGHDAAGRPVVAAGTVKGYSPADAVWLEPQSTLRGLLEKVTGTPPHALPPAVEQAAREADPGRWRQAGLDAVPVGFVTDAGRDDLAAGSPLLDGRGRLVGLAVGRAPAGTPGRSLDGGGRTVAVDIRYLLWMLERVDGAWGLMRDLGVEPRLPRNPEASSAVTTGEEP
jgi:hypothetical protein